MEVKIRFQIRIHDLVIGPGKVALLEGVATMGSISGAAKATGMTFR
ncbi:MAG TPA: ModE family transcriptional regulator, partial [Magnetococcales bacterium]|nr:ModE family transcriptional regulator [Magnetococcales bacterium]